MSVRSDYFVFIFFFFNDTATTEIYTLSLHDALPISGAESARPSSRRASTRKTCPAAVRVTRRLSRSSNWAPTTRSRSEEHTSELQSRQYLVCRLLLEKKKKYNTAKPCA